jgi:pyruvate dehydrogenase phosphatase
MRSKSTVLATRSSPAKPWVSVLSPIQHLTSPHGASSPAEVARLQAAHPAEAETVVSNGRVLGQIAVSRALGDGQWKMAPIYVEKVRPPPKSLRHLAFSTYPLTEKSSSSRQLFVRHGPARIQAKLDRLLPIYLTPPYLSASPAVVFTALPPTPAANDDDDDLGRARGPTVLLFLCSDGLKDLYDHRAFPSKTLEDEWIRRAGDACHPAAEGNAALSVLNDAIGAEGDLHRRSASLTVRLPDGGKFADDTTVIVASW